MTHDPGETSRMPVGRYSFDIENAEQDSTHRIPASAIIGCLPKAANNHAHAMGFGSGTMREKNLLWVLLRLHVRLGDYPGGRQRIDVETWPSGIDSRLAYREFRIFLGEGSDSIGEGTSAWMMLDAASQRPVAVAGRISPGSSTLGPRAFTPGHVSYLPAGPEITVRRFPVRLSDIDRNRHVNNLRYIEWIVETMPEEIRLRRRLRELSVEFRRQVRYGETVDSLVFPAAEDGTFVHRMSTDAARGTILHAWTRWV